MIYFKYPVGKIAFSCLLLVFLSSIILDQFSKQHAHETLLNYEDPKNDDLYTSRHHPVFTLGSLKGQYFRLEFKYSRNKGAAFSMLADLPDKVRVPFFYLITLIAVIVICYYLKIAPVHYHLTIYGLVMILSGAVGNFIDRVSRGYVVDFIDTDWNILGWQHDFAIFNVADMAINFGAFCLILDAIIHRHDDHTVKDKGSKQDAEPAEES